MTITIRSLKEKYGKTPKSTNSAEMKIRVEMLIDELDRLELSKLPRMKAKHPVKWNRDFRQKQYNGIRIYANVDPKYLRKAPIRTIEGATKLLDNNIEWLLREHKREEIRRRSAEEWRMLERAYITKARYTLTDLYDDFKTLIEKGEKTWADYTAERKKWKTCKHRFCLEIYPISNDHFRKDAYFRHVYAKPKRKDSKFCCDQCKKDAKKADKQFEITAKIYNNPTYLPKKEIKRELRLDSSVQDEIYKKEISYQAADLEALADGSMKYESFAESTVKENKDFWWGECKTYNINDLTDVEIKEEKLEKYARSRPNIMLYVRDSADKNPLFFAEKREKKEVV